MKTLFLTHNDLDAASCVIVAQLCNLDVTDYRFCDYTELLANDNEDVVLSIDKYDRIVMADLTCTKKLLDYLKTRAPLVSVFDHHELTSEVSGDENVVFDTTKSGTEILYDTLKQVTETYAVWDEYTQIVSAYDLWKLDSPLRNKAEDLNRLYYKVLSFGKEGYEKYRFFIETQIRKLLDAKTNSFWFGAYESRKIEEAKADEQAELISANKSKRIKTDDKGIKYIVYYGSRKISFVCNELLTMYPDVKYIINLNTYSGTKRKRINGRISVRSQEGFDVTTLAHVNGHKQAGGGSLDLFFIKRLWIYAEVHLGYK